MRRMEDYFDDHGYIVTMPDRDGGDSFHNHGMYRFARYLKFKNDKVQLKREQAKYEQELDGFEDPKKKSYYRRHPDKNHWWSRSNNFTRDQQRPGIIAMGALGLEKRLVGIFLEHVKRFGFYQNNRHPDESRGEKLPDIAAPNHWGEYIRAFYVVSPKYKWVALLWPLLLITDAVGLVGLLLNKKKWKDPDHSDDDNVIISLLQARVCLPTPISCFTRKYYIKNRPLAGFIDAAPDQRNIPLRDAPGNRDLTGPESCVWWKHNAVNRGPPLYEAYLESMHKFMRD